MKAIVLAAATGFSILTAAPILASPNPMHHDHGPAKASAAGMAEGTVKKVDKSAGKLTIAHGPLANLSMPAMTMAFPVKDVASLDQVKAGDKIRFRAEPVNGVVTVVALEAVK